MTTCSRYSCLGNPTDRGAWQAANHRTTESDMTEATNTHARLMAANFQ